MSLEKKQYLRRVRILLTPAGAIERLDIVRNEAAVEGATIYGAPIEIETDEVADTLALVPAVKALIKEIEAHLKAQKLAAEDKAKGVIEPPGA
jgi:hypothetical protein